MKPMMSAEAGGRQSNTDLARKLAGFAAGMAVLLAPVSDVFADVQAPSSAPMQAGVSGEALRFDWKGSHLRVDDSPIFPSKASCSGQHWSATLLATTEDTGGGFADLPPCLPWSKGPCVSVDGPCFADESKCGKQFKACTENKDCLKGLSCLARCGGDPTCSTGCFAAFGDDTITTFLGCALEEKECISFPKDPKLLGWLDDGPNAPKKIANFDMNSMKGDWFKVYGLDSRYDCFECQANRFRLDGDNWRMDTTFRLPRARGDSKTSVEPPLQPGTFSWPQAQQKTPDVAYFQNDLTEEVIVDKEEAKPSMHTTGRTFGLQFWENYYIVGQGEEYQFVRYVGHTVQGGYKGAFVLAKNPTVSAASLVEIKKVAKEQGLNWKDFCNIKNDACGERKTSPKAGNDVSEFIGDAGQYVKFMFDRQVKVK